MWVVIVLTYVYGIHCIADERHEDHIDSVIRPQKLTAISTALSAFDARADSVKFG